MCGVLHDDDDDDDHDDDNGNGNTLYTHEFDERPRPPSSDQVVPNARRQRANHHPPTAPGRRPTRRAPVQARTAVGWRSVPSGLRVRVFGRCHVHRWRGVLGSWQVCQGGPKGTHPHTHTHTHAHIHTYTQTRTHTHTHTCTHDTTSVRLSGNKRFTVV